MADNYITCREAKGSINISEEVISSLVRASIAEVEGVAGLSNTAGAEIAELIGLKSVTKGVKVRFVEGVIIVDTIITVCYGCNIVSVAREVQSAVAETVHSVTGIEKTEINVHVSGVEFDK